MEALIFCNSEIRPIRYNYILITPIHMKNINISLHTKVPFVWKLWQSINFFSNCKIIKFWYLDSSIKKLLLFSYICMYICNFYLFVGFFSFFVCLVLFVCQTLLSHLFGLFSANSFTLTRKHTRFYILTTILFSFWYIFNIFYVSYINADIFFPGIMHVKA